LKLFSSIAVFRPVIACRPLLWENKTEAQDHQVKFSVTETKWKEKADVSGRTSTKPSLVLSNS